MNELQLELKNQLERFRNDKIEPTVEHDDRDENFKMEIFRELGELGFCGMTLPEEFGGVGPYISRLLRRSERDCKELCFICRNYQCFNNGPSNHQ